MNKIFVVGRITKDFRVETTNNGIPFSRFSMADKVDDENTNFFQCVAWRGCAENIAKYARKGTKIAIFGKMQSRSYENKDGVKVLVWELIVENFDICGGIAQKDEKLAEKLKPVEDEELPF